MEKKYYFIGGGILGLIVILGLIFFFTSGNKPTSSNEKIELIWWKTFEDTENVEDLIDEYQKKHPNVTINYVKKDVAEYEADLINTIASGNSPDIFTIHNDWLPKHVDKLAAMPESLMTEKQYRDAFVDVASADFIKDGKIYALPMAMDLLVLYYNKDMLASQNIVNPPTTWKELMDMTEKLTQESKPGTFSKSAVALGTVNNVNRAVDILTLLMLQNGTQFYSSDFATAQFDQPINDSRGSFYPGSQALTFYTQFADPSRTVYTWNARSDFSIDAFTQGKLAMMVSYYYMKPVIIDKAPNLNWAVAAVPQISATGNKVNFANYWGEAVSKYSANQEAAWGFLKYITEKESAKNYYSKHKLPAARKDILVEQQSDIEIGVWAENAPSAKSVYEIDPTRFEGIFAKMIEDVVLKNVPVDTAIQDAANQINLIHQK